MKTLGQRIKYIRTKAGLDQKEFADLLDVKTSAAVSNWEKDKREPDIYTLQKVAKFGGTTVEWLILGEKENKPNETVSLISPKMSADAVRENFYKYMTKLAMNPFPIVSNLSAGSLKEYSEASDLEDTVVLPYPNKNCIVLRVEGNSMKPKIDDGDLVLLDLNKSIKNKDIVAVRLKSGEQMIKRYKNNEPQKSIILYSDNPEYPPTEINENKIEVIYRVVKIIKSA
jgi:phage repressor protein C with HTH and peptisase S24 domain